MLENNEHKLTNNGDSSKQLKIDKTSIENNAEKAHIIYKGNSWIAKEKVDWGTKTRKK